MPWFKIDDSSHSHPKFIRAGNAALGLWLRCGSYSAQHLTEGVVPGPIAQLYGTGPQAAKLVKTGLWHAAGHDCDRCPQPASGDYVIHDFFEGGRNTTRAQYEANKKAAADRAAKSRAGKKAAGFEDESSSKTDRFDGESSANRPRNEPHFSDGATGQEGLSHRTPADGVTHAHAAAMPSTSYGSTAAAASEPEIRPYDTLADLKRAITDAGLTGVSWNLQASQIERARKVREHVGIALMVQLAVSNVRLKGIPAHASAWLTDWESLEPAAEGVTPITAAKTGPRRGGSRADLPTHEDFNQGRVQVNL